MGLFAKIYGPHANPFSYFLVVVGGLGLVFFESTLRTVSAYVAGIGAFGILHDLFFREISDAMEKALKGISSRVEAFGKEISSQAEELGAQIRELRTEIESLREEIGALGKDISQTEDKTGNLGEEIRLLREQVETLVDDMDTEKRGEGYGS